MLKVQGEEQCDLVELARKDMSACDLTEDMSQIEWNGGIAFVRCDRAL